MEDANNFAKNILYHFDFIGDKLIIGRFCSIGSGVKFIMNGANHYMGGFSTFPFNIFGGDWSAFAPKFSDLPYKGDTIIGDDVWIGFNSIIMPGVKIGNGSIIGANSTVSKDVEPYSIVAGNPARLIRKRFDDATIKQLSEIDWPNWDIEKVTRNLSAILSSDIKMLKSAI
jgi:virginiamycin A acetyltransferase